MDAAAMAKRNRFLRILSISGALGVLFYFVHVFIGGMLWHEYDPIKQTISELTGAGAPNAELLRLLTTIYGLLTVLFSLCLYFAFRIWKLNKLAVIGAVLLVIMEISSLIGYGLFPLELSESTQSIQNMMHMVVTVIVVLCTLGSSYLIAIGLLKSPGHQKLGKFALLCAVIITHAGCLTPISMANSLPITGLVERINIFTLQIWLFVTSLYILVKMKEPDRNLSNS